MNTDINIDRKDLINYYYKKIFDSIHGDIQISNIACSIIDHPCFQRLRNLHQLGSCYLVFPTGNYSRFEHSIGTYYIAGMILDCINKHTSEDNMYKWLSEVKELERYFKNKTVRKLDIYICELIKIAALCHDIGHGPFSHTFDDVFLANNKILNQTNSMYQHENRSLIILEYIIKSTPFLKNTILDEEIEFIKNIINPNSKIHYGFIYQIVSNSLNGLDVDKYDYISRDICLLGKSMHFDFSKLVNEVRVIDNIICYPKQFFYEIIALYQTRYRLHKQIYCHKTVISMQYMLNELLINLDPILNITDSVNNTNNQLDINNFCRLTDDYILTACDFLNNFSNNLTIKQKEYLLKATQVLEKIKSRNIYTLVDSIICLEPMLITINDFKDLNIDIEDIFIFNTKIGFVSGNKKNPLDNIYFYNTKITNNMYSPIREPLKKESISKLISETYQEYITMVFYKNKLDTDNILLIKNKFKQLII